MKAIPAQLADALHDARYDLALSSGGMELLFGNQKAVEAEIPASNGGQVRFSSRSGGGRLRHRPQLLPANLLSCSTLLVQLTVAEAMAWARDNLLTERPELFMKGSSV